MPEDDHWPSPDMYFLLPSLLWEKHSIDFMEILTSNLKISIVFSVRLLLWATFPKATQTKMSDNKHNRNTDRHLKQPNVMLVVIQTFLRLSFVLIFPWHSYISRFSTGISHICKMFSLEAYIPCQGAYTQHDTLSEQFLFSKVHFHHRITVSYCLTTGKKTKTPSPNSI